MFSLLFRLFETIIGQFVGQYCKSSPRLMEKVLIRPLVVACFFLDDDHYILSIYYQTRQGDKLKILL